MTNKVWIVGRGLDSIALIKSKIESQTKGGLAVENLQEIDANRTLEKIKIEDVIIFAIDANNAFVTEYWQLLDVLRESHHKICVYIQFPRSKANGDDEQVMAYIRDNHLKDSVGKIKFYEIYDGKQDGLGHIVNWASEIPVVKKVQVAKTAQTNTTVVADDQSKINRTIKEEFDMNQVNMKGKYIEDYRTVSKVFDTKLKTLFETEVVVDRLHKNHMSQELLESGMETVKADSLKMYKEYNKFTGEDMKLLVDKRDGLLKNRKLTDNQKIYQANQSRNLDQIAIDPSINQPVEAAFDRMRLSFDQKIIKMKTAMKRRKWLLYFVPLMLVILLVIMVKMQSTSLLGHVKNLAQDSLAAESSNMAINESAINIAEYFLKKGAKSSLSTAVKSFITSNVGLVLIMVFVLIVANYIYYKLCKIYARKRFAWAYMKYQKKLRIETENLLGTVESNFKLGVEKISQDYASRWENIIDENK